MRAANHPPIFRSHLSRYQEPEIEEMVKAGLGHMWFHMPQAAISIAYVTKKPR